jgi:hypothetical protein
MSIWTVDGDLQTETIDGVSNVVTAVPWKVEVTVGSVTAVCRKSQSLAYDPANPFVDYPNLDQETVIGWVKNALGEAGVTHYEDACTFHANRHDQSDDYSNVTTEVFAEYKPAPTTQTVPW